MTTRVATDATATIAGRMVPLERGLAVHHPSRLGDSTARSGSWARAARRLTRPGQEELLA